MDIIRIFWVGYGHYPNLTRTKKKKKIPKPLSSSLTLSLPHLSPHRHFLSLKALQSPPLLTKPNMISLKTSMSLSLEFMTYIPKSTMGSMATIWRLSEARRSLVVGMDENSFSTSWRLRDAVFVGWWRSMGGCCSGFSMVRLMDIEEEGDEELRSSREELAIVEAFEGLLTQKDNTGYHHYQTTALVWWKSLTVLSLSLSLSLLTKKLENFF